MSMIVLVVSNSFEDASTELQLEAHDKRMFELRRASVSIIKAINSQILILGAGQLYHLIYRFGDLSIPIPILPDESDISISNLSINSIDHYFYINWDSFSGSNDDALGQLKIFRNILSTFPAEDNISFNPQMINNFIGELVDWIDDDNQPVSDNFLVGQEFYDNSIPKFSVKNAKLDSITELLLMPSFSAMNLLSSGQSVFDLPFKIFRLNQSACYMGPLDINMLPPDKEKSTEIILRYISWVKNVELQDCKYKFMYDKRSDIADLISSFLDKKQLAPYQLPLNKDDNWTQQTLLLGAPNAKTALIGLFDARSNLIEVKFTLHNNTITQNYIYHMFLRYPQANSINPNRVSVVYFFQY